MKLVFINHAHPDTPHVSAMRMDYFARAMVGRGHQVVLLTGEPPAQPGYGVRASEIAPMVAAHDWAIPLVLPVHERGTTIRTGRTEGLPPLVRRAKTAWRLLGGDGVHGPWVGNARPILDKLADAFDPGLAWATFGNTSNLLLGQWLARRAGCPWVADIKDNWGEFIPRGLRHAVAWRFRGAAGMTSNAWLHLHAAKAWGESRPSKVVYSGVAEAFYRVAPEDQGDGLHDVLLVGSTYSNANLHVFLSALKRWAELLPASDRARLRFVYAGSDVRQINEALQATPLPCSTQVLAQRPLEELARMTRQSLMNCYLTSNTGFHQKLLELLVVGKPVVCFPKEHAESRHLAEGIASAFHECTNPDELVVAFNAIWNNRMITAEAGPPPAWRWDDFSVELEQFFAGFVRMRGEPCAA